MKKTILLPFALIASFHHATAMEKSIVNEQTQIYAVFHAIETRNLDLFLKFFNGSVHVDSIDTLGNTFLHAAVKIELGSAIAIVRVLLEQGANIEKNNLEGQSPLDFDIRNIIMQIKQGKTTLEIMQSKEQKRSSIPLEEPEAMRSPPARGKKRASEQDVSAEAPQTKRQRKSPRTPKTGASSKQNADLIADAFKAARTNDVTLLRSFTRQGLSLGVTDSWLNTLLHAAIEHGAGTIAAYLIDTEPKLLQRKNRKGDRPWQIAAKKGNLQLLHAMHKADHTILDNSEANAHTIADGCEEGQFDILLWMITQNRSLTRHIPQIFLSALKKEQTTVVTKLLRLYPSHIQKIADPEALLLAARLNLLGLGKLWCTEHPEWIKYKDSKNKTVFHYCHSRLRTWLADFIVNQNRVDILHFLSTDPDLATFYTLLLDTIASGPNDEKIIWLAKNVKDPKVFLRAVRLNQSNFVQLFCEHQPDLINVKDTDEKTAVEIAQESGHNSLVIWLLMFMICNDMETRFLQTMRQYPSLQVILPKLFIFALRKNKGVMWLVKAYPLVLSYNQSPEALLRAVELDYEVLVKSMSLTKGHPWLVIVNERNQTVFHLAAATENYNLFCFLASLLTREQIMFLHAGIFRDLSDRYRKLTTQRPILASILAFWSGIKESGSTESQVASDTGRAPLAPEFSAPSRRIEQPPIEYPARPLESSFIPQRSTTPSAQSPSFTRTTSSETPEDQMAYGQPEDFQPLGVEPDFSKDDLSSWRHEDGIDEPAHPEHHFVAPASTTDLQPRHSGDDLPDFDAYTL